MAAPAMFVYTVRYGSFTGWTLQITVMVAVVSLVSSLGNNSLCFSGRGGGELRLYVVSAVENFSCAQSRR